MTTGDIDRVIERLTSVIDWAWETESRIGFFAAMYRRVTAAVLAAIENDEFENGERMTRLDVIFAERYLRAVEEFRDGEKPTRAWEVSFQGADRRRPIIVQQLLTGINAHINLDLGIAAATVAPGDELPGLRNDFDMINDVLAGLVEAFMMEVAELSPWISLLDRIGAREGRKIVNFSIDVARDASWEFANRLAPVEETEWPGVVAERDTWTADFGRFILHPGVLTSFGLMVIRGRETGDIRRIIETLGRT